MKCLSVFILICFSCDPIKFVSNDGFDKISNTRFIKKEIPKLVYYKWSREKVINLYDYYDDEFPLKFKLVKNSNPEIVKVTLDGKYLSMKFSNHQTGFSEFEIEARYGEKVHFYKVEIDLRTNPKFLSIPFEKPIDSFYKKLVVDNDGNVFFLSDGVLVKYNGASFHYYRNHLDKYGELILTKNKRNIFLRNSPESSNVEVTIFNIKTETTRKIKSKHKNHLNIYRYYDGIASNSDGYWFLGDTILYYVNSSLKNIEIKDFDLPGWVSDNYVVQNDILITNFSGDIDIFTLKGDGYTFWGRQGRIIEYQNRVYVLNYWGLHRLLTHPDINDYRDTSLKFISDFPYDERTQMFKNSSNAYIANGKFIYRIKNEGVENVGSLPKKIASISSLSIFMDDKDNIWYYNENLKQIEVQNISGVIL